MLWIERNSCERNGYESHYALKIISWDLIICIRKREIDWDVLNKTHFFHSTDKVSMSSRPD